MPKYRDNRSNISAETARRRRTISLIEGALGIEHVAILPAEADAPLLVDADGHLEVLPAVRLHRTGRRHELERKYQHHDKAIKVILSAIRELTTAPAPKRRPIGFTANLGQDE